MAKKKKRKRIDKNKLNLLFGIFIAILMVVLIFLFDAVGWLNTLTILIIATLGLFGSLYFMMKWAMS